MRKSISLFTKFTTMKSSIVPSSSSLLLSILSQPNWERNPSLKELIPSISPSVISALFNLNSLTPKVALDFFDWVPRKNPRFRHNVDSHYSLLNVLIRAKLISAAKRIRSSMIRCCDSSEEMYVLLNILKTMNAGNDDELSRFFKLEIRDLNYVLMGLGRLKMIEELKAFYLWILDNKMNPNMYTFNTMINAYCQVSNVAEAKLYLSKILQHGWAPDTFCYTSFILGHCRNNNVGEAYRVFKMMPQKGCRRNEVSYTNLVNGLCKDGKVDEALKVYNGMYEDKCSPDVRTCTVLIQALCASGRKQEGLKLFREMAEKGCWPNVHTYTVLIDSMCKGNELDLGRRMLDEMSEKGLVPSVITYNALIDGYCKEGKVNDAYQVVRMMESKECFPNARTFNQLIHGFCMKRYLHRAMKLLDAMLERNLAPTVVTFNSLIDGHSKAGRLKTAFRLKTLMIGKGLVPDEWTYSLLVDGLCKQGRLKEALTLFDSLKEKSIKMNVYIYTSLIDGFCKAEKIDDAHQLFESMVKEDIAPTLDTYNVLIDGLCRVKKRTEALLLFKKMDVKSQVTYTILIEEMLKDGAFDSALSWFDEMVSSGCKPDVVTYTAFLNAYSSRGMIEATEKLICKMNEEGIKLDIVAYSVLIEGYLHLDLMDRAFDVLKSIGSAGENLSDRILSSFIQHLLISHMKETETETSSDTVSVTSLQHSDVWKLFKFEIALKLFTKLDELGCTLTANTYGVLIEGLCNAERLEEAQKLVNHMRESKISPNEEIYNSLLRCCCTLCMYEEAVRLFDAVFVQGCLPHLESCRLLVCGLYDEGKNEQAKEIFSRLLDNYSHEELAWEILIDGLSKRGYIDRSSELLGLMEENNCQPSSGTYEMIIDSFNGA